MTVHAPKRPRAADRRTATVSTCSGGRPTRASVPAAPAPLVWTFDGPFERCLADIEDTLRRAIVLVGDVARVALLIEISLPALQRRVRAGDTLQPAWAAFLGRLERYGVPAEPRIRHLRRHGPLATLVVAYRH